MIATGRVFGWIRNILALFGVLFCGLVLAVGYLFFWYQSPPEVQGAQRPTLESAKVLLYEAGVHPAAATRLIGGMDGPYNLGTHVQAYCVEATGVRVEQEWRTMAMLDPLLERAAAVGIDAAHAALACVPSAEAVKSMGLPMKLISVSFQGDQVEQVRVAVRDPSSGVYYLLYALHP